MCFLNSKLLQMLAELDLSLFYQINQTWTHPILDTLLPLFRNKVFWAPLYLFLVAFSLINFQRKGLWIILCLAATVVTADFTSSKVVKPTVKRERPCNDMEIQSSVRNLVNCGAGKSFTSSHATNHFAIAIFLSMIFGRKRRWIWLVSLLWASIISYSQVYVGVHYPFDILGGAILGTVIGFFIARFCRSYISLSVD